MKLAIIGAGNVGGTLGKMWGVPHPVSWTRERDVRVWPPRRSSIPAPLCDRVS